MDQRTKKDLVYLVTGLGALFGAGALLYATANALMAFPRTPNPSLVHPGGRAALPVMTANDLELAQREHLGTMAVRARRTVNLRRHGLPSLPE